MSAEIRPAPDSAIIYPDSDGQPMADNTLQLHWIMLIKGNLDAVFAERPDVFVAGDLLWYPVEGRPTIRRAPDALVAFGRPKGYRGSYMQWRESGIAPQVVFEVLSPNNTFSELRQKLAFYERYGVEEYYLYDPDHDRLSGWLREGARLRPIAQLDGWISPRLGIRFVLGADTLHIFRPDGQRFVSFEELDQRLDTTEQARQQAEQARQQAEQRIIELSARLRALGIDPEI
jgi:Uma2 family endonuclease